MTEQISVLHVDDEPEFAEMTATYLEREDDRFAVETATCAEEGLESLDEGEYDCVVSDYDMPGKDGIEFLKTVRDSYPDLPFVLFTGKGSEEVASEAISAGVTDYLQKGTGTEQYELLANRLVNAAERHLAEKDADWRQTIIQTMNEGVYVADADHKLRFVNNRVQRQRLEDWVGQSLSFLTENGVLSPTEVREIKEGVDRILAGETDEVRVEIEPDLPGPSQVAELQLKPLEVDGEKLVLGTTRDVTDRKERERELERYEAFIWNSSDVITHIDEDGTILYQSPSVEDVLGHEPGERVGDNAVEYAHPDDAERIAEKISSLVKNPDKREEEAELRYERADGSHVWIEAVARDQTDTEVGGVVVNSRDITERKKRERELERYEAFVRNSSDVILHLGEDGTMLYQSPGTERIYGRKPGRNIGDSVFNYVHPEDRERAVEEFHALLNDPEKEVGEVEVRVDNEDDGYVWVEAAGADQTDTEVGGVVVSLRDITERKEREKELERYREYTDDILDAVDDLFFVHNEEGNVQRWNDSFAEVTGYSDEEIASMKGEDFVPEEYREEAERRIEEVFEKGSARLEAPVLTKEGSTIPYEFAANRVEHPDGDPRLVGIGRDMTERKERERELEVYERMLNTVPDVVYALDEEGELVAGNNVAAEITGYESVDTISQILDDEDIERGRELVLELLESEDRDRGMLEMELITADGERIPCENHIALRYENGEFKGTVGVLRNMSKQKERQRELERQNERLEEFASVVSHDLRSPLSVAKGRLELARDDSDSEHLEKVADALDRMEKLIEDILVLAREGTGVSELETLELGEMVEDCWQNVETDGSTLVVETELTLRADASRLKQVCENLIRNAVEHGSTGEHAYGSVTVTVGETDDGEGFYVEDDGPGISEEECEKVFESGYSTSDGGAGLGLSIVRDVAEAHSWQVDVTESEGGGARFEITGIERGE